MGDIVPKKGYERKGMDVHVTAEIPFSTAVLGGEAVVPTLDGRVSLKIPAATQPGRVQTAGAKWDKRQKRIEIDFQTDYTSHWKILQKGSIGYGKEK